MPHREPNGPAGHFEAVSFNPRSGTYLRTRHHTAFKAAKRLRLQATHERRQIIDHTPEPTK